MNDNPFDTPPAFVNDLGVKWWPDHDTTRFATQEDLLGTRLRNAAVWFTEHPDGVRTRVLILGNELVESHSGLEAMAVAIEKHKALKRFQR